MLKFPEIKFFRNAVDYVRRYLAKGSTLPTIEYLGHVKLHGTNAGVHRSNGQLRCQSRNVLLAENNGGGWGGGDHYGFAPFIADREDIVNRVFDYVFGEGRDGWLFGEWIGSGIQDKVGIAQLPQKQWVIFAAVDSDGKYLNYYDIDARINSALTWVQQGAERIFSVERVMPHRLRIDFNNPEIFVSDLEKLTLQFEKQCPWAKLFGIEGIGEGLVWTPRDMLNDTDLWFKTKGEEHRKHPRKAKTIKFSGITPEVAASIEELVEKLVDEDRLSQVVERMFEEAMDTDPRYTGQFLKFFGQDLKAEELDTIEASGATWSQFWKKAMHPAKAYWMERCRSV